MAKVNVKRRVAVVTGTRAEYGIFFSVMEAIKANPKLELQVIVTGMHLLRKFGYTVKDIEADGWQIDGRVRLQSQHDDVIGQSRGLGRAITGLTYEFEKLKTDIVLVLGDRLETFAAAAAATASQLVLAHIHGGEAAAGIQDDAYRHAISKLAHIHLAASQGAQKRLLRLGEDSFRIYRTGSPALDNLSKKICRDISQLNQWAGFDVSKGFLFVLQHPSGGSAAQEEKRMVQTLRGCDGKDLPVLVLYPNCDVGFSGILKAAGQYCRNKEWKLLRHVPRPVFLGLLKQTKVLVGNSSGGIIEAGHLNVDVINIGPRQLGRERGSNVLDIDYGTNNVSNAVEKILKRRTTKRKPCKIYGNGRSGYKIASVLAKVKLSRELRQKKIAY